MPRLRLSQHFTALIPSASLSWLIVGPLFCGLAVAADIDEGHLLPRPPPPGAEGRIVEPPAAAPLKTDVDQVLVEALTAIVLFDEIDELGAVTDTRGVHTERLDLPNKVALGELLERFIGKPVTLSLLADINRAIVKFARGNDRPVIDAFAPQGQDITEGVVQFIVVAGRRGEVRVEGADRRIAELLNEQTTIHAGDVIAESNLRADLEWFNRNPFRQVNAILERGDEFGETDITYNVVSRRPYRVYGGLEDSGTRLSGRNRWLSGVNWGNAFGLDHQFSYQFTSSFDTNVVNAHSFSYLAPLRWRHIVEVYGAHVDSNPELTAGGFNLEGKSWQLGMRYRIPLARRWQAQHTMEFGYDYRRSNNDLEFGALRISNTTTVVSQFLAAYDLSRPDRYGHTAASLKFFISPGDMFSDNVDENFAASRFGSSADYIYIRFEFARHTRLPAGMSWITDLTFQYANDNLLGSEQLGIGGYRTVRGYDDYEVPADVGLTIRNEIRSPGYSVLEPLLGREWFDRFKAIIFMDYGIARSKERLPGEPVTKLWSAGLGFRYGIATYLSFRLDYGWQLKELSTSLAGDGRLHLGLVVSY